LRAPQQNPSGTRRSTAEYESRCAQLATARHHFHIDTNVGGPISPAPENVRLPRLLGGEIVLRGYPLAMVYAEKIVTAIARGTVNTRWRDFADIYMLSQHHAISGSTLWCEPSTKSPNTANYSAHRSTKSSPTTGRSASKDGRLGGAANNSKTACQISSMMSSQPSSPSLTQPILGTAESHSWNPASRAWA